MKLNSNEQAVSIPSIREYCLISTPGTHQEKDPAINEICSTSLPDTIASWHRLGEKQGSSLSMPGNHWQAKMVGTDHESSIEHCHPPTVGMITQEYPARFLDILIYQSKCSCGRPGHVQHSVSGR